jgi:nucleotide-binding universal stress UspA family protein
MSIFPTTILLATDGSGDAKLASDTAATLAESTGSGLHVVCVGPGLPLYELPDYPARFEEAVEAQRRDARKILDEQVEGLERSGVTVEEVHLAEDERPERAIVDLAEGVGAGLVVVGSRGLSGLKRALMGSVSASVVSHAHSPVLVVRDRPLVGATRILLATDGSENARRAAGAALELAHKLGSELHVTYVEPMPERRGGLVRFSVDLPPEVVATFEEEAEARLEKEVRQMEEGGGEIAGAHARTGDPATETMALAEELGADLLVVGTRGLGGIKRALMGSVSQAVVAHAHCPVMVVRDGKVRG